MTTACVFEEPITGEWNGRRLSFESEVLAPIDMLFRFALHLTANRADADDLVQETLLKAYQAWDSYERGTNVQGWLVTILRRRFINSYRRDQRRRELVETNPAELEEKVGTAPLDDAVDGEIVRAIDALPLPFREAVVLRDIEGLAYDEIASALELPAGTVKSRLFRAREILKERLHDYAVSVGLIPR